MENKTLCIGELLKFGYAVFKTHWKFLLGVFLLAILIWAIPSFIANRLQPNYPILSGIMFLIYYFLCILVGMGLIKISLKFTNNEIPAVEDLFSCYRRTIPFLCAQILFSLIVMAGLLLLIFPGFIWGARYALAPYFIIDKNQGPIEALQSSAKATYGAKWDFLGFFLTTILLSFGGALCFGFGMLVTSPIIMIANALAYRKLLAQTPNS